MSNRLAVAKQTSARATPRLDLLENRPELRTLARAAFGQLPRLTKDFQAAHVIAVFAEKYSRSKGALTIKEQSLVRQATSLIVRGGHSSHLDDLRSALGALSRASRRADAGVFSALAAKLPRESGATSSERATAPRASATPKAFDFASIEDAVHAGAHWSPMDQSYMVGQRAVTIAPRPPSQRDELQFEYYDSKAERWKMGPRSALRQFE